MTHKPTKVPRRKAKARKTVTGNGAASPKPASVVEANTAATSPVVLPPPAQPSDVARGPVNPIPPSDAQLVTLKKEYPSARSAIVSAAFDKAISGKVRRRLKAKGSIAVIFLVPEAGWIEPVQKIFGSRFGPHWQTVAVDSSNNSAAHKSARNAEVATHLARGRNVVGIAAQKDALPSAILRAADLTIKMDAIDGKTVGRAIRLFTGKKAPAGIDQSIASGLEFHDLLAAFRRGSAPGEIVERLQKATAAFRGPAGDISNDRIPSLEDAVEYGAAREWGLKLAQDIATWSGSRGLVDWNQTVDRGAVLFSPPGFGKTFFGQILAKAIGAQLLVFSVADLFANGPGYLDSVIKQSREIFARSEAIAKAGGISVLMLDECDALPNRATLDSRGRDWWTSLITSVMLSIEKAGAGQIIIGCTNYINGVDAALLRPGRLERQIELKLPDHAGVVHVLRYHLDDALTGADLSEVGHLLAGSTPAEIMMAVRSARRIARNADRALTVDDLLESIAPPGEIEPKALLRISLHEASHAVASIKVPAGILQRCIVGVGPGSSGRTIIQGEKDDLETRDSIERRAVATLAGRAAERLLLGGSISLGSGGDVDSDLALVTQFLASLHASTGLGGSLVYLVSHADALQAVRSDPKIRSRVERHMRRLQVRADNFVREHRDAIEAVAEQLRVRRHLSGAEIRRIVEALAFPGSRIHVNNPKRKIQKC
jgi:cell division protease FtsH